MLGHFSDVKGKRPVRRIAQSKLAVNVTPTGLHVSMAQIWLCTEYLSHFHLLCLSQNGNSTETFINLRIY